MLPALDATGVRCYFVSIGTPQRGLEFCAKTGFPAERLLADPDNVLYTAADFKKSVQRTFFNAATPFAMW